MEVLKIYNISEVNSTRLDKDINDSNSINGYVGHSLYDNTLSLHGDSILDEVLLDSIITNHVSSNPVFLERLRIQKRKSDGIEAYQTTQAELRLSRLANGISDTIYTEFVYRPLDVLINYINAGNWLDAYNTIDSIQPNDYLTSAMLLNFKNQIANYIVGKGDYMEYTGKIVDPLTGIIYV